MNNRPFLKLIALLLAGIFAGQECARAVPMDPAAAMVSTSADLLARDPARFEVPPEFATLKEIHKGTRETFIIHIQDAHSNLSGQENLASTLDGIMKKYGVYLVLVEGGSIDGTLTPLKKIAPPEIARRVAKSLLIDGKIAGEEYLNLVSEHPMKIMGVEDMPLYMESVRAYERLAGKREAILDYLKRIDSVVAKLKNRIYPEDILQYERKKEGREGVSVDQDLDGLLDLAERKKIDLADLPNVARLRALKEKERAIDFDLANLEQAALV
ncbi:MAG TPA: hypothetical protein VL404_09555, partial [Candidatus Eisenbacteria bacterium]|nr:hypothetical protein [Candidatus Eisenbacteria bacterium]